ncbi:MAG: hypothetical protein ACM3JP_01100 [Betaproteobacteria bacterium]
MDAMTGFERSLASWLGDAGPDDVPGRVLHAALAEARTVRQRRPWLTEIWWVGWRRASMAVGDTVEGFPVAPARRPSLRLVWVLVALAALLALLGGLISTGAIHLDPAPVLAACPAGASPDVRGPTDQARPPDVRFAAWDPVEGRSILALAGDEEDRASTWRFDVCTNTWRQVATAGSPPASPSDGVLVSDVDSARLVFIAPNGLWSFDPKLDRWRALGPPPPGSGPWLTAAYDPVTGNVVVFTAGQLWNYDVESRSWDDPLARGKPREPVGGWRAGAITYDAAVDRFVLVTVDHTARASTWELDLRGRRWLDVNANDTLLNLGLVNREDFLVYDERTKEVVAFGVDSVAAYDARTQQWRGPPSGGVDGHWAAKAYDPLNGRVVVLPVGGMAPTRTMNQFRWAGPGEPVAFDLATGSWSPLLDAAP